MTLPQVTQTLKNHFSLTLITGFFGLALLSSNAIAANIAWNGLAGDGLFNTDGNWVGGTAPEDNDFRDNGVFGADGTPTTVTVVGNRDIAGIRFETTGWTLTGSRFDNIRVINSAGTGTNVFNNNLEVNGSNATRTWTIGAGNTLHVTSNTFYMKNNNVSLTGGGIISIDTSLTGFGTGSYGLLVQDATARFNNNAPAGNNQSFVSLNDPASIVQVQTSIAGAQSLVSAGDIVDGVGSGLAFTDIGGGYTEITSVPEPATYALFFGCVAILFHIRKRRMH